MSEGAEKDVFPFRAQAEAFTVNPIRILHVVVSQNQGTPI